MPSSGVRPDARKVDALCYDVSNHNAVCKTPDTSITGVRASVNEGLKDELMDECLADAIYYVGDEGAPRSRQQ